MGFDYFRSWLIMQGRKVFERIVTEPDALADLPVIHAAAARVPIMECEDKAATGEQLPDDAYTTRAWNLMPGWTSATEPR